MTSKKQQGSRKCFAPSAFCALCAIPVATNSWSTGVSSQQNVVIPIPHPPNRVQPLTGEQAEQDEQDDWQKLHDGEHDSLRVAGGCAPGPSLRPPAKMSAEYASMWAHTPETADDQGDSTASEHCVILNQLPELHGDRYTWEQFLAGVMQMGNKLAL
jgi:hypothetical protein